MLKWYGDLPVVFLEGSPKERGLAHGKTLGDMIHQHMRIEREVRSLDDIGWDIVLERTEKHRAFLEEVQPTAYQELESIARGAEVPVNAIIAMNAQHNQLWDAGCTTVVALPDVTYLGHTLVGKNRDGPYQRLKTDVLFVVYPESGPRFATLAAAGTLTRDGFNDRGLVLLGNGLNAAQDDQVPGIPFTILRRHLLAQSEISEAKQVLEMLPRSHACNYTIASVSGRAYALEATVDHVFSVAPSNGLLIHTNHFVSLDAKELDRNKVTWGGRSQFRLEQLRALLEPKTGRLTLKDIQSALADHTEYPNSICSHRKEGDVEGGTLSSYWMDLYEEIFYISNGPPCMTPITEVPLRDLGIRFKWAE